MYYIFMYIQVTTYRVKGYETVMYYVDIRAENKADAYTKAMDVHVDDWQQQDTVGLWDNGGFKIKKKDIEQITSNVVEFKPKEPWAVGYEKWKKENNE